jgi:Lrp/AsnC family transcriptional regulator, leucine-responsive regulatory protein
VSLRQIDDLDRKIIDLLREDGRAPNSFLATKLGVSETTIAIRIRSLRERKVMLVTLQRDFYSQGFDLQCLADVHVVGREVEAVAREFAALPNVTIVTMNFGTPEIVITFNARDRRDVVAIVDEQLATVRGVERIETYIALDIRKYESWFGNLAHL